MRSKVTTFLLFIFMVALLACIVLFGIFIYKEVSAEPTNQVAYNLETNNDIDTLTTKETHKLYDSSKSIFQNIQTIFSSNKVETPQYTNLEEKFFYKQLSDNQKILYNGLDNNKQNLKQGDYVINFGETFSEMLASENGSKILGDDYQSAIEAFLHDNPELFYLDVNKMYLSIETTTKFISTKYNVYISPPEGQNYLAEEFNAEDLTYEINMVEEVRDNILRNLPTSSTYSKIVYIHDYLVDNIEYDTSFNAKGAYSIYGALVTKHCVCEGYAKALKYLLNSAGIECEIMQGTATNSANNTENHAWNCVNLEGKWYLIDATWDDPVVIGKGKISSKLRQKYLLKGSSTFAKDHVTSYKFSDRGREFSYPTISVTDY